MIHLDDKALLCLLSLHPVITYSTKNTHLTTPLTDSPLPSSTVQLHHTILSGVYRSSSNPGAAMGYATAALAPARTLVQSPAYPLSKFNTVAGPVADTSFFTLFTCVLTALG